MDLAFLRVPPTSTLLILGLSAVISLVTTVANRLVMDIDEFRKWTIDSHYIRQEMMSAMRSGNKRQIAKAQKQQQEIMQTQQRMTMNRMKIMLFFFIPFILIWQVLHNFFRGVDYISLMPFKAPWIAPNGTLTISTWYIFCSVATNIVISRILGLTFEIEPK
jgi:uncharacterized membrane protein (DUF106 family)